MRRGRRSNQTRRLRPAAERIAAAVVVLWDEPVEWLEPPAEGRSYWNRRRLTAW